LLTLGIKWGDRVGVYLPNWPEYIFFYLGAANIGATTVPVNWTFTPQEVKFVINNAGVSVLVMSAGFLGLNMLKNLEAVRNELPALQHIIMLEKEKALPGMLYDEFLAATPALARARAAVQVEDPVILFIRPAPRASPRRRC
jgi:fatty-acyl-CoA synthase